MLDHTRLPPHHDHHRYSYSSHIHHALPKASSNSPSPSHLRGLAHAPSGTLTRQRLQELQATLGALAAHHGGRPCASAPPHIKLSPMSVLQWRESVWNHSHQPGHHINRPPLFDEEHACFGSLRPSMYSCGALSDSRVEEEAVHTKKPLVNLRVPSMRVDPHSGRALYKPLIDLNQPTDPDGRPIEDQGRTPPKRASVRVAGAHGDGSLEEQERKKRELEKRHRVAMRKLQAEATDLLEQTRCEALSKKTMFEDGHPKEFGDHVQFGTKVSSQGSWKIKEAIKRKSLGRLSHNEREAKWLNSIRSSTSSAYLKARNRNAYDEEHDSVDCNRDEHTGSPSVNLINPSVQFLDSALKMKIGTTVNKLFKTMKSKMSFKESQPRRPIKKHCSMSLPHGHGRSFFSLQALPSHAFPGSASLICASNSLEEGYELL